MGTFKDNLARKGVCTLAAAVFVTSAPAPGVSQEIEARIPTTHEISRATGEITIDGVVDEAAWSDALHLELRYEVEPGENVPAPVRTEAMLTYTDESLLVAFRCHDTDPSRIRARVRSRDQLWQDDFVGIILDTFNDERRAFEFAVNPLGVQMDSINDDVNRHFDPSWGAIWESKGRLTDWGYEVEFAIPFNQLRFRATDGKQVWGIDVYRSWPRDDSYHLGLVPRARGAISYLSQVDKLTGFEGIEPGRNLELAPTVTYAHDEVRSEMPDGDMENEASDVELGATLRWGVTPEITLSGAVNPDFSQVEADVVQLGINQQFELFYREARPFFLESADYFNTQMNLLHTRMVVDPMTALKITGKKGRHTFAVFTARDELTPVIIPGSQGSDSETFELSSTVSVGRYRYDFGKNSTVGGIFTDRRGGGYESSVLSFDLTLRLSDADEIGATVAASKTAYNDDMAETFELEKREISDLGLRAFYRHSERDWNFSAGYTDFGDEFRADVGFIPKVGYRQLDSRAEYIWWGDVGQWYRNLEVGARAEFSEEQDGTLLEREVLSWVRYEGPLQSRVLLMAGTRIRAYDGVDYDQIFGRFSFHIRPNRSFRLGLNIRHGDWIDFEHSRPAEQLSVTPSVDLNFGKRTVLRLSHDYSRLDVEPGMLYDANVSQLRAWYHFTTRTYVRAVVQFVDVSRNPLLYEDEVDAESKDLFTQLLFSYTVNPQTVFYAGYSDTSMGTQDYELTQENRTFFVKIGYAFLF